MYKFFGNILNLFNSWTGNYMLALLLFALMVKIILIPLAIMQQKNQIKGAKLRPKMLLIEKKYAGRNDQVTLKKKQAEIMELQQKEGYSALSGCLPLLIQFPIIIILYRVIQKPLTYVSHLGSDLLAKIAEAIGYTGKYSASEIEFFSQIKQNMGAAQTAYAETGGTGLLSDVLPKMSFFGADLTLRPYFWSILLLIPVLN
ncbi:MAG: membrane protein insertase YidC, partial [Clostridia bacterium]|nr:membrane protein insertase YidC [Clostridia bacterium]